MSSIRKKPFPEKQKVANRSQTMPIALSSSGKSLYCCCGYFVLFLLLGPSRVSVYHCSLRKSCQKMRAGLPFWPQVNLQHSEVYFQSENELILGANHKLVWLLYSDLKWWTEAMHRAVPAQQDTHLDGYFNYSLLLKIKLFMWSSSLLDADM